jgi:signal transduction histidine kinase
LIGIWGTLTLDFWNRIGVREKYQIVGSITAGSLVALALGIDVWLTLNENIERIAQIHERETSLVFARGKAVLDNLEMRAERLHRMPWTTPPLNDEIRKREYQRLLMETPPLRQIELHNGSGQIKWKLTQYGERTAPQSAKPIFLNTNDKTKGSQYYVTPQTREHAPTLTWRYQFEDSNDWLIYTIDLRYVIDAVQTSAIGKAGRAFLVDRSGVPIVASDGFPVSADLLSKTGDTATGRVNSATQVSSNGVDFFRSVQRIGDTGLSLVGDMPLDEANISRSGIFKRFAVALCAFLIGAYLLNRLTAKLVTRPIIELKKLSDEYFLNSPIGLGKEMKSNDEVSVLAESFNTMAEGLRKASSNLELRLAQKTSQLETEFVTREAQSKEIVKLEERARIVRDFHDGVGGHLVGLLGAAKRDALDAKQIEAMVSDALVDFRIAIDSLSPEDTDLTTALAGLRFRLLPRLKGAGLESEWSLEGLPLHLTFSREIIFHVQRIVAEAITNVIKHAGATRVEVAARVDSALSAMVLEVRDDGVGFAAQASETGQVRGRGVANISQRAQLVGGRVEWRSLSDENEQGSRANGTVMRLQIPMPTGGEITSSQ